MLLIAAAVLGVGAVLHLVKLAVSALFGSAGVVLLILGVAAVGGYYWYRTQRSADARALEAQVTQTARTAASNLTARAQTMWNTGTLAAERAQYPTPATPAAPFTPRPVTGGTPAPTGGAVISALLLIPSLVVYAILWNADFDSPWQPWWLGVGLNVWFVLCAGTRSPSGGRRMAAVLLSLTGTVLAGLASSPSGEWNLAALLARPETAVGNGDSLTYTATPPELLPWIDRLPVLLVVLFVIAWSIARRSHPGWVLGLIPTALLVWWSIWYIEEGMTTVPNWFTFWLLSIGVFVAGCLACLAADALSRPRTSSGTQVPPPFLPRSQ